MPMSGVFDMESCGVDPLGLVFLLTVTFLIVALILTTVWLRCDE